MDTERTGGCLCGAVRLRIAGEPYRVGLCHCMTCRRMTGSAFSTFAVFPADAVTVAGETGAFASSGKGRQHFCRACGSPVFWREVGSDEIEVYVGALDEPDVLRPTYELWIGRREGWLPEIPGLIRYRGNRQGRSRTEP